MAKIKYNKKINSDKHLLEQTEYDDKVDLFDTFDFSRAKIAGGKTKQIYLNVPVTFLRQANSIGNKIGSGYEQAMKLALAIGLKALQGKI
jgi:hypothetical protein